MTSHAASRGADLRAIFGQRMRMARQDAGLTQAALAAQMGWTQSTIAEIKAGLVNLRLDGMTRLALVFGRDPGEMLRPLPIKK